MIVHVHYTRVALCINELEEFTHSRPERPESVRLEQKEKRKKQSSAELPV